MKALILNAGSSTLKVGVLDENGQPAGEESNEKWARVDSAGRAEQIRAALARAPKVDAVGHRVVHGGRRFREAVVIDSGVRVALEELVALDPLHMMPAMAGIEAVAAELPSTPQIAAFDTSFHSTIPAEAGYALPWEWTEKFGLRRYGFHGLSVDWSVSRAKEMLGSLPKRLVVCHLGSGCSITAVLDGASIDTTMGFSPLEGLMMSTRAGSVDPGLLLHLQTAGGIGAAEIADALATKSGLLGVSGISGDLRIVLDAAGKNDPRAVLAYGMFLRSVKRAIGAMSGVMGGIDCVVFTAGIGEHSARVRRDACAAIPGLALSATLNESVTPDAIVSEQFSSVRALVITAREERVVLREILRLVS